MTLKAALIQLTCTPDIEANIQKLTTMIRAAAEQGADFILTPECSDMMTSNADKLARAYSEANHPTLKALTTLAVDLDIWLQIGSLAIKDDTKLRNRSYMVSNAGAIAATYDKIHLFDSIPGDGHTYKESDIYNAGNKAVIAPVPHAKIGMTICYDLRFATLYRHLAKSGAHIITVPAAFTVPTGQAHWETLLRARAIETGCYIIAANQTGQHRKALHTYGHSMIIDPWGKIIAELKGEEGILTANLDLTAVEKTRTELPTLQHDRDFDGLLAD